MPIYAYRCSACGHAKEVLQKMSDPVLTECPACGASTFVKQLTAAGFQLKGSGWYVTDFRGDNKPAAPAGDAAAGKAEPGKAPDAPAAAATSAPTPSTKSESAASPAPAASPTPAAPTSGGSK